MATTKPSDTQVAFPKLIFVYLETISVIISVPPVLKFVLNINPYPNPVSIPPNIAITIFSTLSNFRYGTRKLVSQTNTGNISEPTIAFFVFLGPNAK